MIPNLIVPVLNRYDLLQRMVDSIDYPVAHLLIIDNGHSVNDAIFLNTNEFVKKVTVLPMPSNQGVAGSWNLGIKCFPHDYAWFFSSADTVYLPGALKELYYSSRKENLTLCAKFPHWQTFSVGEEIVFGVGLFDESIYPIYFEDNDYQRRVDNAGLNTVHAEIDVAHDNSATIHSDPKLAGRNGQTFASNSSYYESKVDAGDFSEGRWLLGRRRGNEWLK